MKKIAILLIALLVFVSVGLSGCEQVGLSNEEKNKFVGTWELKTQFYGTITITFFSDGRYESNHLRWITGTYELKDGKLIFSKSDTDEVFTYDYYKIPPRIPTALAVGGIGVASLTNSQFFNQFFNTRTFDNISIHSTSF